MSLSRATSGLLLALLLVLLSSTGLYSCSGGSATLPVPEQQPSGQRIVSERVVLTVLEETYIAGGRAAAIEVAERQGQGEVLVDVSVRGAEKLKALFFHLEYDPSRFGAGRLDNKRLLGPEKDCLALYLTDPASGTIEFGEMLMLPQEAKPDGTEKGFTGNGLVCTLHLKTGAAAVQRKPSVAPGSDGAKASLSYDADTQTLSWQHFSPGDYNQDGLVAVSDLTPIGIHFNQDVPAGSDPDGRDSSSIEDVVDGSNDGKVNVADLTAIGLNYQNRTSSYNIYKGDPADLPASNRGDNGSGAELVESVSFDQRQGNAGSERVGFERPLAAPDPGKVYWVRPMDDTAPGTPSNSITPATPNSAPTAFMQADVVFATDPPLDVTFDLSFSTDSDGNIVLYEMDYDGDGVYELSSPTDPSPVLHTYTDYGLYRPTLRVTDNQGGSATMRLEVEIPDPANQLPSATFEVDIDAGDKPLAVSFDASASSDPDGSLVLYEWDRNGNGDYELEGPAITQTNFVYEEFGHYFPTLRVTDDKGGRSVFSLEITVADLDNLAPIASLSVPEDTGVRPFTVDLDASASIDTDGVVVSYHWDFSGDGVEDLVTDLAATSFVYNMKGTFNPSVFVVDDDGAASNTASKPIEVTAGWESSILNTGSSVYETHMLQISQPGPVLRPLVAFSTVDEKLSVSLASETAVLSGIPEPIVDDAASGFALSSVLTFPAIVYNRSSGSGGPVFIKALDSDGSNWGTAVPLDLSGAQAAGNGISIEIINAKPSVAYSSSSSGLYFVQCDDINGSVWPVPEKILNENCGQPSLLLSSFGELPQVLFTNEDGHPTRMLAEDVNGASWNAPTGIATDSGGESSSAIIINGRPAIVNRDLQNGLVYRIATSEEATFWSDPVVLYSLDSFGASNINLALIDGVPCVAFWDVFNGQVVFIQSTDALGAFWSPAEVVDFSDQPGRGCSLIDFAGQPLIAYGCEDADQLRIAILPSN